MSSGSSLSFGAFNGVISGAVPSCREVKNSTVPPPTADNSMRPSSRCCVPAGVPGCQLRVMYTVCCCTSVLDSHLSAWAHQLLNGLWSAVWPLVGLQLFWPSHTAARNTHSIVKTTQTGWRNLGVATRVGGVMISYPRVIAMCKVSTVTCKACRCLVPNTNVACGTRAPHEITHFSWSRAQLWRAAHHGYCNRRPRCCVCPGNVPQYQQQATRSTTSRSRAQSATCGGPHVTNPATDDN